MIAGSKALGTPLFDWLSSDYGRKRLNQLQDRKMLIYKYLNADAVLSAYPEITAGYQGGKTQELWRLFILAQFLEKHRPNIRVGFAASN